MTHLKQGQVGRPDDYRFPLWKENKVDQEYFLTLGEFRKQFFAWVEGGGKDKHWLSYYGTTQAITEFIGRSLNSVIELDMYETLALECRANFWAIVDAMPEPK